MQYFLNIGTNITVIVSNLLQYYELSNKRQ